MKEVELWCAVYGEATVFPVTIACDAKVWDLQQAIFQKQRFHGRFSLLTLYLARKKGETAWMKDDASLDIFLQGSISNEYEKMLSSWRLDNKEYFGPDFTPGDEEVHVLVELPEGLVAKKKRRLAWRSTRWHPHDYDPNSSCFLLEKEDVDGCGLPDARTMLYCRLGFHDQFKFLREKVMKAGRVGWILGPPGTGKSTTTMAFASTVDTSEWIVTWIHVGSGKDWRCVRLIGGERKCRTLDISDVDEVLAAPDMRHHLVLVDGWTAADTLTQKCHDWFLDGAKQTKLRRLAFVCSAVSRGKVSENADCVTGAVEYRVWSWTLEEYHNAIKDDELFQSVSPYLDDPTTAALPGEGMSRAAMVESKYYYAGGSCRYMFHDHYAAVAAELSRAVYALNEAASGGSSAPSSTQRLFGRFPQGGLHWVSPVISQYAATQIAVGCGPEAIKRLMWTQQYSLDPALNGWKLEMVFFTSLRKDGLALLDAAGNTVDTWGESILVVTDGIPALSSVRPVWIKPEGWNPGGYDAIMVCKRTQHVRFVQVARAHKHSLRIEYFYRWLAMLSESPKSFEVKTLEIVFIVETDRMSAFKFATVTGEGLLEVFGWPKGKESGLVRLVAIRGRASQHWRY
jgi:hypothetical protein